MRTIELLRLGLSRLGHSRLRTALTMLGIIIGVASVVALVSVGQGATSGITSRLQGLGTNLLTVNPGATRTGFTRGAAGSANTLTVDDANAIAALPGVAGVEPEIDSSQLVIAGTSNETAPIIGTSAAYASVRDYTIWLGSFLTPADVTNHLRVAVLGATTASNLGLGQGSIGTTISVGGLPFQVVGIFQPKGTSGAVSADDEVVIPITTMQDHFDNAQSVRTIGVSVASAGQIELVKADIQVTLEGRHGIAPGGVDDFSISDQSQLLQTVGSVTGLLSILLAGIASISLLVGGIGIMNIMLVSVRERTREIGIRKAIGAKAGDIMAQFLIEALAISLIGGLVGIAIGVAATAVIGLIAGWGFVFNPLTVLVAVVFSLAVGVIFGVWPARQAARLDPILALRYE